MTDEIAIRAARQEDVETMIAIYRDCLADNVAVGPSPATLQIELRTSIGFAGAHRVFVAEYEGSVIAWSRVLPWSEARPTIRSGEIRAHAARGYRNVGFDDALFWEAESSAEQALYVALSCYGGRDTLPVRCVCEHFRYEEMARSASRDVFAFNTGPLIVFEKRLAGGPVLKATRSPRLPRGRPSPQ